MQASGQAITRVFRGTTIHTPSLGQLRIQDSVLAVDSRGRIAFIRPGEELDTLKEKFSLEDSTFVQLSPSQFLIPGFIDTHIHAAQYPNTGLGLDRPLLGWLAEYTFPLEARFCDPVYARHVYSDVIRHTLRSGTTTACYYTTVHTEAATVMCDLMHEYGQRGLVGKTCMDHNSPPALTQTVEMNIEGTKQLIAHISHLKTDLLSPVLTPRFALSCSVECMQALGALAREGHYHIQTHISENKEEVETVRQMFPNALSYTHLYQECGLLTDKTILAHAVHLSDQELATCREERVGISHCPVSNFALKSGLLDCRRVLERDIKLGLGTDVSGGYAVSMLEVMRQTLIASSCVSFLTDNRSYRPLDYREAFHLATLGGARVLGLEDRVGSFEEGKEFDALLIDTNTPHSVMSCDTNLIPCEMFQKFFYTGDDRNISQVFVRGRLVHEYSTTH